MILIFKLVGTFWIIVLKTAKVHFVTNDTFVDLKFTSLIFKTVPTYTLDRNENVPMYIRGLRIHLKEENGIPGGDEQSSNEVKLISQQFWCSVFSKTT